MGFWVLNILLHVFNLEYRCRGQGPLSWVRVRTTLWFWGLACERGSGEVAFLSFSLWCSCTPLVCMYISFPCLWKFSSMLFLLNVFSMKDSSHSLVFINHSCKFFMVSKELTCFLHTKKKLNHDKPFIWMTDFL